MIPILACLATIIIAGGGGFAISYFIQRSGWGATKPGDDVQNSNAGVCILISLFGGGFIGVFLVLVVREFSLLPFLTVKAMDAAYITALLSGCAGSLAGMMVGLFSTPGRTTKSKE